MFGENQTVGFVSLAPDLAIDAGRFAEEQLAVATYASLDDWSGNASVGKGNTTAGAAEDCLAIVAKLDDLVRQRLLTKLSDSHPGLPIVVLTPEPTVPATASAVRQGAFTVADLSSADSLLSSVLRSAADEGRKTAARRKHLIALRQRIGTLTPPERQVLDAMLDGMANKQIAQALEIGLRTVELRRSKIMRKMNARSLAELIKFVCQVLPQATAEPPVEGNGQSLNPVH